MIDGNSRFLLSTVKVLQVELTGGAETALEWRPRSERRPFALGKLDISHIGHPRATHRKLLITCRGGAGRSRFYCPTKRAPHLEPLEVPAGWNFFIARQTFPASNLSTICSLVLFAVVRISFFLLQDRSRPLPAGASLVTRWRFAFWDATRWRKRRRKSEPVSREYR